MNPSSFYKPEQHSLSPIDCMYDTVPDMYSTLGYSSSSSSSPSSPSSGFTTPEPETVCIEKTIKAPVPKKQYQCTECLKYFSRPSALQTHSYTHTSEKPFQCLKSGCGRKFSVVSNLRRHFKVHQKPAVSNKLSSEDRLRYVRQLIKTSDVILARKKQAEKDQRSLVERSQYNENHENNNETYLNSVAHLPQSSNYRYQHYFLFPKISNIVRTEGSRSSNSNHLNESVVQLPSTCNSVEQNRGAPSKPQSGSYYTNPAFDTGRHNSDFYGYNMNNYNSHNI